MHSSNSINDNININPFFPFIPHNEDEDSFFLQHIHNLLHHHHQPPPPPVVTANPQPPFKEEEIVRSSLKKKKKDRHSKINTAKGPRDRRMRLSLDIARRFFDLQDLLGFDKASRTVEWLLSKSSAAIQELSSSSAGFVVVSPNNQGSVNSTTSECEVVSKSPGNAKEKKTNSNFARKSAFDLMMAKESRKAARERAKERTREKIRTSLFDHDQGIRPVMNNLDAISPNNHHLELQLLQDPSSSSIIFNYEYDDDHQNLHGIPQQNYEDWDNCCQNMGDLQQHKPMSTWFNN